MNQINHKRMSPEEVARRFECARKHLEFRPKLYKIQIGAGRYLLHEHPHTASSWKEQCIKQILKKSGVMYVVGDQCMYGFKITFKNQEGPARKIIGYMTNQVCIAQQLQRKCLTRIGNVVHKHIILEEGRTKQAQVHSRELCQAICVGLQKQIRADEAGQFLLTEAEAMGVTSDDLMKVARELKTRYETVEEPEDKRFDVAWGDVSGAELDPGKVKTARAEEVEYVRKMRLYDKVLISQCYQKTGKAPISVRWIDINKGDAQSFKYRSRLVAREINTYKRNDLFAATLPLEALKMIISMTATSNRGEIIMVNGISRAFFHARVIRDVYVQLHKEDQGPAETNLC